jgi:hypothetical protein
VGGSGAPDPPLSLRRDRLKGKETPWTLEKADRKRSCGGKPH